MTLTSVLTKLSFSGNGSTTVFAVSFVYYDDDGLRVILVNDTTGVETVQTLTTQYTLSGGSGVTGTLTMLTAPPSGETLIIKSAIDDTQETDFPTGGNLRSTSIEEQMDILTRLVQQKEEKISRMMILKESTTLSDLTFPDATALGVIRWNAAATALEATIGLSAAGGTFIEDSDSDTKIQVEESADEDIIRFDVAGVEVATMSVTAIAFGLPVAITGAVTVSSTVDGRDIATDGTKLDTIESSADVTDTTNVTSAGALMDSELTSLSGVKTLTVPDSTTISTFGATLVDDTTATLARGTLGVVIGTDVQAFSSVLAATTASYTTAEETKLSGIEASADVTDYTNVAAALAAPSANLIFNEASGDFDVRFEGLTNTHLLFLDAGNNRVGISSASLAPTDGLVHIQSSTAGVVTAPTEANEVVIEGSGDVGVTILSGNTSIGGIHFGSVDDSSAFKFVHTPQFDAFGLNWDDTNLFTFIGSVFVMNDSGANIDFRIEGDTVTDLFFIDASTDNVHINNTINATTALGHLHIGTGTSPTAVLANGVVLGSKDSAAGGLLAVLELWIEEPPEVIGTFTPSHKHKIWINGTEYFIQLDAV